MKESGKPSELMAVLDYVLNRCTLREIDALESAVARRRKDLASQTGILSLNPARAAREMSETVRNSINSSMDSIRGTFRTFAADMLRKEAPELSQEQMEELIDSWIPQHMTVDASGGVSSSSNAMAFGDLSAYDPESGSFEYSGLAHKGLVNGIPCDAMYEMIRQFVEYSVGAMPLSDEAALRDAVGDWTTIFWKNFPREIQELVKRFLSGNLSSTEFDANLSVLLQ